MSFWRRGAGEKARRGEHPIDMGPYVGAAGLTLGDALRDVSFSLPVGSCTAVLGANGGGKSTLLAALAGVLPPDAGQVFCVGPAAYLPEGCPLDGWVSVRRWLAFAERLPGWEPEVASRLTTALSLPMDRGASQLSQGQRVRLGLIMTLGRRAPVYLLDDPFLGLDPMAQVAAERFIAERAADATVLIANQDAAASERLCSHLLFLRSAELSWCAPMEAWRERFRRVRVRGPASAVESLGLLVLHAESRGRTIEVLLDDPTGSAEDRLRARGVRVEAVPLPLDELLLCMVA